MKKTTQQTELEKVRNKLVKPTEASKRKAGDKKPQVVINPKTQLSANPPSQYTETALTYL